MKTAAIIGIGISLALAAGCSAGTEQESLGVQRSYLARSSSPPGGIAAGQAPQFVLVTFDDNFSSEGMSYVTSLFSTLNNPAGTGNPATFDGAAARTTFYHNSTYLAGTQSAWAAAVSAGHETGDHTVNHGQGLSYTASQWTTEIGNCRSQLMSGLGLTAAQISGFRAPYLAYNDAMFTVLGQQSPAFVHDTSIQSCWATAEGAGSCPWPYTLDAGSADADTVVSKFGSAAAAVNAHAGLWEIPVTALVVPPDSVAAQYAFTSGLRSRVQTAIAGKAAPSFYEPSSGKIAGLDITLLVDASMNKAEALATLKYNLDLHLAGNRAPLAFVAHTHVYASGYAAAVNVPNMADRRAILSEFFSYALSKSAVRIRPTKDVVSWMQSPVALGGSCVPSCSGKTCGSNGCGGSCGTCSSGQTCNASQQCESANQCTGVAAYAAGLQYNPGARVTDGGHLWQATTTVWWSSASCPPSAPQSGCAAAWQDLGACSGNTCTPICSGKQCGSNGCGGSCGTCGSGQTCNASQQCVSTCTPACSGKQCGSDGCGGSCGTCSGGQTCNASQQCVSTCTPACSGKQCGSDGCGGSCGTCSGGQTCNAAQQCTGGGTGTCNPAWVSGGAYTAGSLVSRNSVNYQCRPWPNSGWCPSYDPASSFGADAWTSLGACTP